jgi:hypothetical protein
MSHIKYQYNNSQHFKIWRNGKMMILVNLSKWLNRIKGKENKKKKYRLPLIKITNQLNNINSWNRAKEECIDFIFDVVIVIFKYINNKLSFITKKLQYIMYRIMKIQNLMFNHLCLDDVIFNISLWLCLWLIGENILTGYGGI